MTTHDPQQGPAKGASQRPAWRLDSSMTIGRNKGRRPVAAAAGAGEGEAEAPPQRLGAPDPAGLRRWTWVPIGLAAALGLLLLATTLWVAASIRESSRVLLRGEAQSMAQTVAARLAREAPATDAGFAAVLEALAPEGLRYLAFVTPAGVVRHSAGAAEGAPGGDDFVLLKGGRARLRQMIPPPVGGEAPEGRGGGREGPRPPPILVIELEPELARDLERQATTLQIIALAAFAAIIALGAAMVRGLRQRERLLTTVERERRLASLGEMSAVLAHEIRNPLAALKGHAQLLAEQLPAGGRPHQKAERVIQEALRLEGLANDLLDYVRVGAIRRQPVDPAELLEAAARAVDEASIRVLVGDGIAGQTWSLDRERLLQALENILRNAVQAEPDGSQVEAAVAREGGALVIRVRDHGAGVPPGEEEEIFQPFVTHRVRGTGLGLAITRRIVESHGGAVVARNHPEGGAVFTLTLPAAGNKER